MWFSEQLSPQKSSLVYRTHAWCKLEGDNGGWCRGVKAIGRLASSAAIWTLSNRKHLLASHQERSLPSTSDAVFRSLSALMHTHFALAQKNKKTFFSEHDLKFWAFFLGRNILVLKLSVNKVYFHIGYWGVAVNLNFVSFKWVHFKDLHNSRCFFHFNWVLFW